MSEPAFGLDCLAVAVVRGDGDDRNDREQHRCEALVGIQWELLLERWTGRMLRDARMVRIVSGGPARATCAQRAHNTARSSFTSRVQAAAGRARIAAIRCGHCPEETPDETSAARSAGLRDHLQRPRDRRCNGAGRRPQAGHDHVLERVHDARAARLPAGLRRLPQEVPVDHGQGHGQHPGRQDHRCDQPAAMRRTHCSRSRPTTRASSARRARGRTSTTASRRTSSTSRSSRRSRSRTRATRACSARCPPWPTPTAST